MQQKTVFLSGGIERVSDYGSGWRSEASQVLEPYGYRVLNPCSDTLERSVRNINEIVHRNLYLQRQADLLLVEYNNPARAYLGTDFELAKAREWDQPAIVWAHSDLANRVYMQYLATVTFPTLGECLEYILQYYRSDV